MTPLWIPTDQTIASSQLRKYMSWLENRHNLFFHSYDQLWSWSVENNLFFWTSLFEYFQIKYSGNTEVATKNQPMPHTKWFEEVRLNYAENIFQQKSSDRPAILFSSEQNIEGEAMSWEELENHVSALQQFLIASGVQKGDRVAAFLTNTPHATIAMLATTSIGAIWSCCSPDFGVSSVVDRFQQIQPKILIAVNGYTYNGKVFDRTKEVSEIRSQLPSLSATILVDYVPDIQSEDLQDCVKWETAIQTQNETPLYFEAMGFNDPLWILYSSGTTGKPKAITHAHGGMLLEHLKYLHFHNDVHPGERFFWYSTTGWMMWNFVQASLLAGATIVLYEGSPAFPGLQGLWEMADRLSIHHFGTSAPFIVACMKAGLDIKKSYPLKNLRSIGSTGSPLPPEGFQYVYEHISSSVWLTSMSGGTDVCTAFVGGNVTLPVYQGQIQCRTLGCSLFAFDGHGYTLGKDEVGEMVITRPMPCMPVFFWNDEGGERYKKSYFDTFPGIWRHGDWIKITQENGVVILGRSDATLNRHGVRIGTAEIYASLQKLDAVKDSLVVNLEMEGGKHYMPLFIVLNEGFVLDESLKTEIANTLKSDYTPRHVPDAVFEVKDLPYTMSGKKLETPVKKILMGMKADDVSNKDAIRNPESLDFFKKFKQTIS